jgi:hypothetical protein
MRRNAAAAACQVLSTDAVAALAIWSRDAARTSARNGVPMDAGSSSPSGGGLATSLHALTAVRELPDFLLTTGRLAMRDMGPVPSGPGLDLLRPPR